MDTRIPKFSLLVKLSLLGGGVALALISPVIGRYFRQEANQLVQSADRLNKTQPSKALVHYRLATWLNPFGRTEIVRLARAYESAGRYDDAINSWGRLPAKEGKLEVARLQSTIGLNQAALKTLTELLKEAKSAEVLLAKARVEIDLGKFKAAAGSAEQASSYGLTEPKTLLILGLTQKLANQQDQASQTVTKIKSGPEQSRLTAALADDLALGAELYAQRIYVQSEKVLSNHVEGRGPEPYNLLARIKLAKRPVSRANLNQSGQLLKNSLKLNPVQPEAHQLLVQIYNQLGNPSEAARHQDLIKELGALKS